MMNPFKYGSLELDHNIVFSPLAGCSDYAYRKISRKYHSGLFFCEMVKMDALIRNDLGTHDMLAYDACMHPIGAQLCGSKKELAAPCAKILEDLGFDTIDLNCGCPVDKVTKDGSGSGLLKTPELIGDILCEIKNAVSIPISVKIRAGWDESSICGPEIVRVAEAAGADVIYIHGRTRKQGYTGPANRDYIREAKAAANTIPVFGNGDIFDGPSAKHMLEHTGCDGLLVSRGTMGEPWIARDILHYLNTGEVVHHTFEELFEAFCEHVDIIFRTKTEKRGALDTRRISAWYLKNFPHTSSFRQRGSRVKTKKDVEELIQDIKSQKSLASSLLGPQEHPQMKALL
jgi:tRNA-dihydrouridine synthase B